MIATLLSWPLAVNTNKTNSRALNMVDRTCTSSNFNPAYLLVFSIMYTESARPKSSHLLPEHQYQLITQSIIS